MPSAPGGERPPLDVAEMLRALDARSVRYVVIGGVAGRAHGDQTLTYDLDITPDPASENLQRLAAALTDMGAGLRVPGVDEPLTVDLDAGYIRQFTTMATRSRLGDLDVVVQPDGIPGGYAQLAANAIRERAFGVTIAIAGLDDLIATRRAAAVITGLQHYDAGAARLAALGGHGRQPSSTDVDVRRACFPEAPAPGPPRAPRAHPPSAGPDRREKPEL